jgi:hypothetical protein
MARNISKRNSYRLLGIRGSLLMGLAARGDAKGEYALRKSLDEATDVGAFPLLAECAFHIGAWRFSRGEYAEARDYLSRSVSITARLAEDLGSQDRVSHFNGTT